MRPSKTEIQRRNTSDLDAQEAAEEKKLALADVRVIIGVATGVLVLLVALSFLLPVGRVPFVVSSAALLFTLIAIVYQGVIYRRQWNAMREMIKLDKQALQVSNKAYVGIHSLEAELKQGHLILLIENTGNIPAKDVKVDGTVSALIMDIAAGEGSMLRRLRPDIASRRFSKEFSRLFRGNLKGRMVIDLDLIAARGDHYVSGIAEGRGVLVVEGRIEYSDGFEDGLITRFAFNYDRDSGWTARPIEEIAEARESGEN